MNYLNPDDIVILHDVVALSSDRRIRGDLLLAWLMMATDKRFRVNKIRDFQPGGIIYRNPVPPDRVSQFVTCSFEFEGYRYKPASDRIDVYYAVPYPFPAFRYGDKERIEAELKASTRGNFDPWGNRCMAWRSMFMLPQEIPWTERHYQRQYKIARGKSKRIIKGLIGAGWAIARHYTDPKTGQARPCYEPTFGKDILRDTQGGVQ